MAVNCPNIKDPEVKKLKEKNRRAFLPMWRQIGEKALDPRHYDAWMERHPEFAIGNPKDRVMTPPADVPEARLHKEPEQTKEANATLTQEVEAVRSNLHKLKPGKSKGESVTSVLYPNSPINEEKTPQQLAGTAVHKVLEHAFKIAERGQFTEIEMKQIPTDFPMTDKAKNELIDYAHDVLDKFEVVGTEIPIAMDKDESTEWRGKVDVILYDKTTKQMYVVDYKTTFDAGNISAGTGDTSPASETKFNKTYMQTAMYKEMINSKIPGAISGVAVMPFTLKVTDGVITGIEHQKIPQADKYRVGGLFKLQPNGMLHNKIIKAYDLGRDYVDINVEDRIVELGKIPQEFAKKIGANKRVVDLCRSVFKGADFVRTLTEVTKGVRGILNTVKDNPGDVNILLDAHTACEGVNTYINSLQIIAKSGDIERYAQEVAGIEDIAQFVENVKQSLKALKQANETVVEYVMERRHETLKAYWEAPIKNKLKNEIYRQKYEVLAWKALVEKHPTWTNRHKHINEIVAKTNELMKKNEKDINFNINSFFKELIDEAVNTPYQTVKYQDMFRRIAESPVMQYISPRADSSNIFVQSATGTLLTAFDKWKVASKEHERVALGSWKKIPEANRGLFVTENAKGQKCLVQEYDKKKISESLDAYVDKAVEGIDPESSNYQEAAVNAIRQFTKENTVQRPIDIDNLKQELHSIIKKADIVESRKEQLTGKIENLKDMDAIKLESFGDNPTEQLLAQKIEQVIGESYVWKDEFKDEKYARLMQLPENSPERILYAKILEGYKLTKERLPDTAQLESGEHGLVLPAIHKYGRYKGQNVPFFGDEFAEGNDNFNHVSLFCNSGKVDPEYQETDLGLMTAKWLDTIEKYIHMDPAVAIAHLSTVGMDKLSGSGKDKVNPHMKRIRNLCNEITGKKELKPLAKKMYGALGGVTALTLIGLRPLSPFLCTFMSHGSMHAYAYDQNDVLTHKGWFKSIQYKWSHPDIFKHVIEPMTGKTLTKAKAMSVYYGIQHEGHGFQDMKGPMAIFNKAAWLLFEYSDAPICNAAARSAAYDEKLYTKNKDGTYTEKGNLWDLSTFEDGVIKDNAKGLYQKINGKYMLYDKSRTSNILHTNITNTVKPVNQFFRNTAGQDALGHQLTSIRTIGLNMVKWFLEHLHWNEISQRMKVGPLAAIFGSGVLPDFKDISYDKKGNMHWTRKVEMQRKIKVLLADFGHLLFLDRVLANWGKAPKFIQDLQGVNVPMQVQKGMQAARRSIWVSQLTKFAAALVAGGLTRDESEKEELVEAAETIRERHKDDPWYSRGFRSWWDVLTEGHYCRVQTALILEKYAQSASMLGEVGRFFDFSMISMSVGRTIKSLLEQTWNSEARDKEVTRGPYTGDKKWKRTLKYLSHADFIDEMIYGPYARLGNIDNYWLRK